NGEVKELSIDNESANDRSALLANRYPLYRVYNITTWEDQHTRNPLAQELVQMLLTKVKSLPSEFSILPHEELRQAGWKFRENELIGEPNDSVASTK
ncbi:MAG: hypothetical protein OEZ58_07355, partial [Gammaproteobacteria bacterium]|nr:hypothetical protein [Gammaproteobacteria bacterium]